MLLYYWLKLEPTGVMQYDQQSIMSSTRKYLTNELNVNLVDYELNK